jgi:HEAT repeat protein
MIPQDTTEIIWTFSGTVVGLIISVAASAIVRQVRHNSTGSTQADRWEDASDAVKGFVLGDAVRSAKFSKLLQREDTRAIVIEALSNMARANPESAKALRHRKEDGAVLRQWVSDSLEDKDAGRRANACEVVATLRLRACHGMVLAATGDEDANVRVTATRALCVLDPETAVGVLLGLIEKEGSWAADLLADLLQRVPVQALAAVMQRAREWGATPALVRLLASCPSEVANSILLSALETDNPELRARVAEAIHASSPESVAALATLLTDPHEGTRLSAVRSLGRVQNPKALITLSSALSDSSRLVRFAAAEGIGGTPGGPDLLSRIVDGSDRNAAEAAELTLWRLQSEAANPVVGPVVEGIAVEGIAVEGIAVEGIAVEGVAVEGIAVDSLAASGPGAGGLDIADVAPLPSAASSSASASLANELPLSARLDRLTNHLEESELTFEMALAALLDESIHPAAPVEHSLVAPVAPVALDVPDVPVGSSTPLTPPSQVTAVSPFVPVSPISPVSPGSTISAVDPFTPIVSDPPLPAPAAITPLTPVGPAVSTTSSWKNEPAW